jgi:hypothetical protein
VNKFNDSSINSFGDIMKEKPKKSKLEEVIDAYKSLDDKIKSDIDGSYTGVPLDGGKPVQDADDL